MTSNNQNEEHKLPCTAIRFANHFNVQEEKGPQAFINGMRLFQDESSRLVTSIGKKGSILWIQHKDGSSSTIVLAGTRDIPGSVNLLTTEDETTTVKEMIKLAFEYGLGETVDMEINLDMIEHLDAHYAECGLQIH